jgi:hypothetical protein
MFHVNAHDRVTPSPRGLENDLGKRKGRWETAAYVRRTEA